MRVRTFAAAALASGLLALAGCTMTQGPPPGDFTVSVALKTMQDPYFGVGDPNAYVVNGVQGAELTLTRGASYTFSINGPGHSFYLSTDPVGGLGAPGELTSGVTGQLTGVGVLTFTPDASTPSLIYYQCGLHPDMGWKIHVLP